MIQLDHVERRRDNQGGDGGRGGRFTGRGGGGGRGRGQANNHWASPKENRSLISYPTISRVLVNQF